MTSAHKLIYAIVFQIGWFVCVKAGNLAGSIYTALFLVLHIWFITRATKNNFRKEIFWILVVFGCGCIIETLNFSIGLLYLQDTHAEILIKHIQLPPVWLLCLWIIFGLALRTCLSFLFNKSHITFLLLCIFVPINYYAGAALSTVVIYQPYVISLTLITFFWLAFLYGLMKLRTYYFEDIFNAD